MFNSTAQLQRVYYADGDMLDAQDFIDEQRFVRDMFQYHNASIFTPGVVHGLQLSISQANFDTYSLTISCGMALDKFGNQLIFTQNKTTQIPCLESATYGFYITISYSNNTEYKSKRINECPDINFTQAVFDQHGNIISLKPNNSSQIIIGTIKQKLLYNTSETVRISNIVNNLKKNADKPITQLLGSDLNHELHLPHLSTNATIVSQSNGDLHQWMITDTAQQAVVLVSQTGSSGPQEQLNVYQMVVCDQGRGVSQIVLPSSAPVLFQSGRDQLSGGKATVTVPDLAKSTTVDNAVVMVTPYFDSSDGTAQPKLSALAVSRLQDGQFTVKAIDENNPSQPFYWEVKSSPPRRFQHLSY